MYRSNFLQNPYFSKIRFGLVHTSRMNIEHTGLILPAHFVSSLTINGAKVFIGFNPEKKWTIIIKYNDFDQGTTSFDHPCYIYFHFLVIGTYSSLPNNLSFIPKKIHSNMTRFNVHTKLGNIINCLCLLKVSYSQKGILVSSDLQKNKPNF